MTQEEKELLLKDLCGRLPHGLYISTPSGDGHLTGITLSLFGHEIEVNINPASSEKFSLDACKPYLRPMGSMTEDEKEEILTLFFGKYSRLFYINDSGVVNGKSTDFFGEGINNVLFNPENVSRYTDWLNKKMFDYRGLIPMGLALEALEGMYNN